MLKQKNISNNFCFLKNFCIFVMLVELNKEEIETLKTALKDSGLEFTNNIILYKKLSDVLDNVSVNDFKT
jgi:hypothetical protein